MAVVAVDPSSPITGGAILGDRVRMQAHAGDRDVFIRSMAARGHAGGPRPDDRRGVAVLDAAGFELVFIETVGTGQSEVEVAAAADTTVVLEAPEMGDEVQAIKAGCSRWPTWSSSTRATGRAPSGRRASCGRCSAAADRGGSTAPPVLITTAATGAGVPELLAAIDRRRAEGALAEDGAARLAAGRRRGSRCAWRTGSGAACAEPALGPGDLTTAVRDVAAHRIDPYTAADRLLAALAARSRRTRRALG